MSLNFARMASANNIILFCIILTLICLPRWIRFSRTLRNFHTLLPRMKLLKSTTTINFFYLFLPLFLFFLYFLRTLLPPSGFDALMYHLSCAQLYLDHGGFYNIFFNPQADFPMLTEMNFMIGLAFNNDLICRQISFLTECMGVGALVLFCRTLLLNWNEVCIAVATLLTLTVTIASVSTCDVDFAMAAWIALSVYTLVKIVDQQRSKQIIIPAFFAGMAMSTKIFGVFVLPTLLFLLLYKKKVSTGKLIPVIAIPLMMGSLWYIKSYIHKGTLLSINRSLIESQGLGLPMGFDIHNQFLHFVTNVVLRTVIAPWTFTLFPSQHQQDSFGPFFVALLPFVVLTKLSSESKLMITLAGIYLSCILLMEMVFIPGGSSIRYSLVLPIFLIPVCLTTLKDMKFIHNSIVTILRFFLLIQIALGSIHLIKRYHQDWIALLTLQDRDRYYSHLLPQYPSIRYINTIPEECTILTLYNYDNYLIKKQYISAYRHYTNKDDLFMDLKKHSVSYIFANNVFDTSSNASAFADLDKTTVFSQNGFYVYKVNNTVSPPSRGSRVADLF